MFLRKILLLSILSGFLFCFQNGFSQAEPSTNQPSKSDSAADGKSAANPQIVAGFALAHAVKPISSGNDTNANVDWVVAGHALRAEITMAPDKTYRINLADVSKNMVAFGENNGGENGFGFSRVGLIQSPAFANAWKTKLETTSGEKTTLLYGHDNKFFTNVGIFTSQNGEIHALMVDVKMVTPTKTGIILTATPIHATKHGAAVLLPTSTTQPMILRGGVVFATSSNHAAFARGDVEKSFNEENIPLVASLLNSPVKLADLGL